MEIICNNQEEKKEKRVMNILLKNALVYDGEGGVPYKSDVLVVGEKIAQVGDRLNEEGAQVLELEGLSVSPGFIDAHSHNDWFAIKKEPLKYFEPFVRQGITSFIGGNCGLSATGFEHSSAYKDKLGAGLFNLNDVTGEYATLNEYFNAIDGKIPMNMAMLMGHCSARTSVAGYENRDLNASELERMLSILEKGLEEGACGLSLGLEYEPGLYAPIEELKDVASLCEKYDLPMVVHSRACSTVSTAYPELFGRPHILRALDELEEITKGTKMKLQYSHAIFLGERSLKYKNDVIEILDRMRSNGVNVMFDIFSGDTAVTVITIIMPAWFQALSSQDKKKPFHKIRFSVMAKVASALLGIGFDNMRIAYAGKGNERYEGKTVQEIAEELGISDINAYLYLCEISNYSGRIFMRPYNTEEITNSLSKHDNMLFMTDAWVVEEGLQHQSIYDCLPKFLHQSLNGKGDTFSRTIRKMTGATADRFLLKNRGYIKPGYFADITIFDENKLKDGVAVLGDSFGIKMVFINGRKVLEYGRLDETAFQTAGHALRAEK